MMEGSVPAQPKEPDTADGTGGTAHGDQGMQPAGAAHDVREVVGRRGYDEAEDETATEEEEH